MTQWKKHFESSARIRRYSQHFAPFLLLLLLATGLLGQGDCQEMDVDGDGWTSAEGDCDDEDSQVNPGATEVCDDIDNNCDGSIDEGLEITWYQDQDGDGYGDDTTTALSCAQPEGYVATSGDCDDTDAAINPGAEELCEALGSEPRDNNCDGSIDEGLENTWYQDQDEDGYGDDTTTALSCAQPEGYVATSGDCDDTDAAINPGAEELCEALGSEPRDNNCDGSIDEGLETTWYQDQDGDGYGDETTAVLACAQPEGYLATSGDCDDTADDTYPGAKERCDGRDTNCDGSLDGGAQQVYYPDEDRDGFGTNGPTVLACSPPRNYSLRSGDCDDEQPRVYPEAPDICDGLDNDCDGLSDDQDSVQWYLDADRDGFGTAGESVLACVPPDGYAIAMEDCDDADDSIYPGAFDTEGDAIDQDCGGADGPQPSLGLSESSHTSLAAAMADSLDGTTLWIGPGDFEAVDVSNDGRDVSLRSIYGAEATRLNGDGEGSVLSLNAGMSEASRISGLTLQGGSQGLILTGGSPTLEDLIIRGNEGSVYGVGLSIEDASPRILRCRIEDNTIYYAGGGGVSLISSEAVFEDCTISGNQGKITYGTGLYAVASNLTFSRCVFEYNKDEAIDYQWQTESSDSDMDSYHSEEGTTGGDGGGAFLSDSIATFDGCIFRSNVASKGGGLDAIESVITLRNTTFKYNKAYATRSYYYDYFSSLHSGTYETEYLKYEGGEGGGLRAKASTVTMNNIIFDYNYASYGGAIWAMDGVLVLEHGTIVEGNLSAYDGYSSVYIDPVDPYEEHVDTYEEFVYGDLGGGLNLGGSNSSTVTNSILAYNDQDNLYKSDTSQVDIAYSDLYNSVDSGWGNHNLETLPATNQTIEPAFLTYGSRGTPDDLHLALDSPMIDTGDPSAQDPDGSRADPGAFGGSSADGWDQDGDGFPFYYWPGELTDTPPDVTSGLHDCDDNAADVHPGATEVCEQDPDAIDNDCDGLVDDVEAPLWYQDNDGDHFGDEGSAYAACSGDVSVGGDCNDADPAIHPNAEETCDGVDNDCDGENDDEPRQLWYADADGDGDGNPEQSLAACEAPEGYVAGNGDCDDGDASSSSQAEEVCEDAATEPRDNDCDGTVDEGFSPSTWYRDADGDGWGGTEATSACWPAVGYVTVGGDCDDYNDMQSPGASEVCDGIDNDCNGTLDDGFDTTPWYPDTDGDGYGDSDEVINLCSAPGGYLSQGGDCNDGDESIHPDTAELCDATDNNCDGQVDEGFSPTPWYLDQDMDGFGVTEERIDLCEHPLGYAANPEDCDDLNGLVYPDAPELCDGIDNDCDGDPDTASPVAPPYVTYYHDYDGDGFGTGDYTRCDEATGFTLTRGDCNDHDSSIHPGATDPELDGVDQDCGGSDGPQPHVGLSLDSVATLEEALGQAQEGDVLWVGPGIYLEHDLEVSVPIQLRATEGASSTILDASQQGRGITITSSGTGAVTLDGLTIRGGAVDSEMGGGILVQAAQLALTQCTVEENQVIGDGGWIDEEPAGGDGGGLFAEDASIAISGSSFLSNAAIEFTEENPYWSEWSDSLEWYYGYSGGHGGAIALEYAMAIISHSELRDNEATCEPYSYGNQPSGGAIYARSSTLTVVSSEFRGNSSVGSSGALHTESTTVILDHSTFEDNTSASPYVGGAVTASGGTITVRSTRLVNNVGYLGGALYLADISLEMVGSTLEGNGASSSTIAGGGIYLYADAVATIRTSTFANNTADQGGAIAMESSVAELDHTEFFGNQATSSGAAVSVSDSRLNMSYSVIVDNSGSYALVGELDASVDGTIQLDHTIIAYNDDGNLYTDQDTYPMSIDVTYTNLYNLEGLYNYNLQTVPETLYEVEPGFLEYAQGIPIDFHLSGDSSMVDAGDPSLTDSDPDGGDLDLGIYGGTTGSSWDRDGDQVPDYFWPGGFQNAPLGIDVTQYDCDDRDPTVQSGC